MRIARLLVLALAATTLAVLAPGAAWAHNSLTRATPAKDATLDESPGGVELTFLQKVDPAALTTTVTDAGRRAVPAGPARAAGKTGSVAFSGPLPDGVYTVAYRVVSLDGHAVQGSYRFTVDDPTATTAPETGPSSPPARPAPVAAAPGGAAPGGEGPDGAGPWPATAAAVAAAVALGVLGTVLMHRRRITRRRDDTNIGVADM